MAQEVGGQFQCDLDMHGSPMVMEAELNTAQGRLWEACFYPQRGKKNLPHSCPAPPSSLTQNLCCEEAQASLPSKGLFWLSLWASIWHCMKVDFHQLWQWTFQVKMNTCKGTVVQNSIVSVWGSSDHGFAAKTGHSWERGWGGGQGPHQAPGFISKLHNSVQSPWLPVSRNSALRPSPSIHCSSHAKLLHQTDKPDVLGDKVAISKFPFWLGYEVIWTLFSQSPFFCIFL